MNAELAALVETTVQKALKQAVDPLLKAIGELKGTSAVAAPQGTALHAKAPTAGAGQEEG